MGFGADATGRELVLTGSWAGRGLFDTQTGGLVAWDTDEEVHRWMTHGHEYCEGIGPIEGSRIRVAGLWGGGLNRMTEDGWSVAVVAVDWPEERVILQPPGADVMIEHLASGCITISAAATELRCVGFAPSGRALVVVTASDVTIFGR